ncbi:glutamyl-Q tRNA(Asp) synthetase [Bifidobacterium vansinderenii]|uniref:Glutamyl-Q tRNA(Asp) ligase n=1 Tax=Bifidobacterium vansinderenii TaxID=1984871 RepID=A0A229VXE5_9BIFI|nr:glutamyl-Q tRNA(Asp) synthetase [Bifidobacterium vansinderenii]OXN00299.1 glutamyl-Q tRNA(Asp) ligase [Bifidobacterium vansinderenii]
MAECRIVDDGHRDDRSAHVALPNTSAGSAGLSKPSAPVESNLSGSSESQRRVGRLAPSPTGRMHIGNVYAALAAWLSVRAPRPSDPNDGHRPGVLRLRIEDIDTPRVRKDADRWIMDDLHWLGLDWDGDPVYQSKRGDLYDQALHDLREADLIYPCFCSRAEIRAASAPQEGDGYVIYPGTCARLDPAERDRRLAEGRRHSWRVHLPAAEQRFDDTVFGEQHFDLARQIGDTVLRRSDGLYAYQLAVVVDDLLMGVNDVVRGRDLLRSTALQLWIRDQLSTAGWHAVDSDDNSGDIPTRPETLPPETLPNPETTSEASRIPARIRFAHLPLVDDPSGKRLAKRDRALDLGVLREEGVTPEAVIGYCAWLLRLQETPQPVSARDLLTDFSWEPLRADHEDRVCDPTVLFG